MVHFSGNLFLSRVRSRLPRTGSDCLSALLRVPGLVRAQKKALEHRQQDSPSTTANYNIR